MGILFAILSHLSVAQPANSPNSEPGSQRLSTKDQPVRYQLIHSESHGYGYDIFVNNTLFVHQPTIPCLPGNKGFKTKSDAKKVATLVIAKIKKGQIPPSVSISEMEKLGIDLR